MTIKLEISCAKCGKKSTLYNVDDIDAFKYMGWYFSKQDNNIHICKSCKENKEKKNNEKN